MASFALIADKLRFRQWQKVQQPKLLLKAQANDDDKIIKT